MSWKSLECRKRAASLARYCDDPAALSDIARSDLERHLERCPECRRELDIVSGVGAVLRANVPPPVEASSELWSRLEAQIRADAPARRRPSSAPARTRRPSAPTFSRWGVAVPAAALAAVAAFGAMVMHQQDRIVPQAANLREASVTAAPRDALPALAPSGQDRAAAAAAIAALEEPIRVVPNRRKRARAQKEALTAARRAAAEARAAAGIPDARRSPWRGHDDPFRSGGGGASSSAVARHVLPKPALAAPPPPVPSLARSRSAPAEPKMLALAEKSTSTPDAQGALAAPVGASPRARDAAAVVASTPLAPIDKPRPAPSPGTEGGRDSVGDATPLISVASNTPGRSTDPGTPVPGGASSATGDRASAAVALSPTEAVNLHNRQRSLFLNYGSAQR